MKLEELYDKAAGFGQLTVEEGVEVIAINRNFSQNLNAYKVALQVPNERVRIIVRRDNQLKDFEFKVRSILNN